MRPLDQKGGVTDPGQADLPMLQLGKNGGGTVAVTPFAGKKGGKKDIGDEAVRAPLARGRRFRFQERPSCPRPAREAIARGDGLVRIFSLGSPVVGHTAKSAVREEVRRRLAAVPQGARREASGSIVRTLTDRPEWRGAGVLGLYLSLPDEPETRDLIRLAWQEGKKVALPKTDIRHGLVWMEIPPGPLPTLETLWEPVPGKFSSLRLDVIEGFCVPGRAFDARGTRLGRGGGHYDRALAQRSRRSWVAGLFFGIQEMEELPREPHDVALPHVVTEQGWRSFP